MSGGVLEFYFLIKCLHQAFAAAPGFAAQCGMRDLPWF
jgi:hypothetical protein